MVAPRLGSIVRGFPLLVLLIDLLVMNEKEMSI